LVQKHTRIRIYKSRTTHVDLRHTHAWTDCRHDESRIRAADCTRLDYERNLDITKGLNTHPTTEINKITQLTGKTIFLKHPAKDPIQNSLLPTEWTEIFGEMLQTLARDRNRPLGLRCRRHDDDDESTMSVS
jgi:hypothetical protein